jgi:hypothetical protein
LSDWDEILKSSIDILEETFADDVKIILKNGDIIKTQAIKSEEDVVINAQFGEILDYNLCLSISEFKGIKKENIKFLEYKNKKYTVLKEKKIEGFFKLYLRVN